MNGRNWKKRLIECESLFDRAPHAMFVVDKNFTITRLNEAASAMSGETLKDSIGLRPGEFLKCIHVSENREQCGSTRECMTCPINMILINTFLTEKDQKWIETSLNTGKDGNSDCLQLKCSTSFIKQDKGNMLILSLEKIDTPQGPESIIPICSKCRKIRNKKGLWKNMENYLGRLFHVGFSHTLCPDCAEKLYGHQKWFKKDQ